MKKKNLPEIVSDKLYNNINLIYIHNLYLHKQYTQTWL